MAYLTVKEIVEKRQENQDLDFALDSKILAIITA